MSLGHTMQIKPRDKDLTLYLKKTKALLDDPSVSPGVKGLLAASASIVKAEEEIAEMVTQLDRHQDMARLIRSALESLEVAAQRLHKAYDGFIDQEADHLRRRHEDHVRRGEVDPVCLACELETATAAPTG